jgi:hypothetical protein
MNAVQLETVSGFISMGMGISGTGWRLNKPGCPMQDAAIVQSGKKTGIIHLKEETG